MIKNMASGTGREVEDIKVPENVAAGSALTVRDKEHIGIVQNGYTLKRWTSLVEEIVWSSARTVGLLLKFRR